MNNWDQQLVKAALALGVDLGNESGLRTVLISVLEAEGCSGPAWRLHVLQIAVRQSAPVDDTEVLMAARVSFRQPGYGSGSVFNEKSLAA